METLRYIVLANGLLAVVSVAYYVLLRRETFFVANRLALWVGLAGALILPLLELPDWRPQRVRTVMHKTAQIIVPKVLPNASTADPSVTITFPNQKTYQAFQNLPRPFTWSWQFSLMLLYILGVLILTFRFGLQVVSLRKLIHQSVHEPYDQFTLVTNEQVTSPFSFFNWVVLNPAQHTDNELDQILRHERVHVRERHSLDMIGAELACIVFWFNPAAYLFRHLVHQTLEFSADRSVLAEGVDAKAYQYNLLKVSLASGQSGVINHFSRSELKSRILMLNRQQSSKASWLKYPIFFIAALTVAAVFAHPQPMSTLNNYIPKPIPEAIETVASLPERSVGTITNETSAIEPSTQKPEERTIEHQSTTVTALESDAIDNIGTPVASRYIEIHDNTLFWIITPLTTFDNIVQLKSEMAKYGYQLDIDEMKYDMLHKYLVRLDATLTSGNAHSHRTTDDVQDNKPMNSFGGQISINKTGIQGINELMPTAHYPTKSLLAIATADEQAAQNLLAQNRIEYLIAEGLSLTKDHWITKRYDANSLTENNALLKDETGLFFSESGYLRVIKNELTQFWLNNRPVTYSDLQAIKIDKFYSIIRSDKYLPDQKEPHRIILIYTKL
ncbi:M56 family metallopeptidase [Spirosoma aerolatum]|uniref:M56 family metallopeptidase n=1 Tax=Spirosoma aerolatum TaxID=1211326 RepID=UPI001FEC3338|nr:M56 family metallopeptidase [Spirosoma aerolatum]